MNIPFLTTNRSLRMDVEVLKSQMGALSRKLATARTELQQLQEKVQAVSFQVPHKNGARDAEAAWIAASQYLTGEPKWEDVADHVWTEDDEPPVPRQRGRAWLYSKTEAESE